MGLLRNLQVRRKGTHPKEVPWENVEKERASKILAGRQAASEIFKLPTLFPTRVPRFPR